MEDCHLIKSGTCILSKKEIKHKQISTRIFTKPISKTWIFRRRNWVGGWFYYKNLDVAIIYLKKIKHMLENYQM